MEGTKGTDQLLTDYEMCFACGKKNPIGLQLDFEEAGDVYRTRFIPRDVHQGYTGILHGGIMCTLLDEVMGRYLYVKGMLALTAELQVRLKKAVKTGQVVLVEGRITGMRGRLIEMEAQAALEDGTVAAEAAGKFIKLKN